MLTGTDVISNQAVSLAPESPLPPSIKLLPEILGTKGYVSACVGFDDSFFRGFDTYRTYEMWRSWEDAPANKAENLNKEAISLLESMAGQQFFLFLRHMDPHAPYLPPPPFRDMFYGDDPCNPELDTMGSVLDRKSFGDFFKSWMPPDITDINWVVAQYDSALAYMDVCINSLITKLKELGVLEDTLIVITSDHGETLTEHGIYFDHHGLYEPTIHIPLILHFPGKIPPGARNTELVLQQDLAPTILDLMGSKEENDESHMDGRSMRSLLEGGETVRDSGFYMTECTWMRKQGWRTSRYKLIQALENDLYGLPSLELYDLKEDPQEMNNIAHERPEIVEILAERMDRWKARRMRESGKPDPIANSRPSFLASGYHLPGLKSKRRKQANDDKK